VLETKIEHCINLADTAILTQRWI